MQDDEQIEIVPVNMWLVILVARTNILFTIKVKIVVLSKWSYRSPPILLIIESKRLAYFEHVVQSLTNCCIQTLMCVKYHT